MSAPVAIRGDGVGIELTRDVVRGVRLSSSAPARLVAAAEVPIASGGGDRAIVDALVRLRAELGDPRTPTRVAVFPPGSTSSRADATGLTGNDLSRRRSELADSTKALSSVLLDDGPRRWLIGVRWDDNEIRRLEVLTERAAFIDVSVDPSPLALARVLDRTITRVRRDASTDQSFAAVISHGVAVAAAAIDSIGRMTPGLSCNDATTSVGWFDDVSEPAELAAEIRRLTDDGPPIECHLELAGESYPDYPAHDLRSPQRQCVALGAAVGAAGLAGRLRPVDIMLPAVIASPELDRPWAIERMSNLPKADEPRTIGPLKRLVSKVLPRRR